MRLSHFNVCYAPSKLWLWVCLVLTSEYNYTSGAQDSCWLTVRLLHLTIKDGLHRACLSSTSSSTPRRHVFHSPCDCSLPKRCHGSLYVDSPERLNTMALTTAILNRYLPVTHLSGHDYGSLGQRSRDKQLRFSCTCTCVCLTILIYTHPSVR